MKTYDFVYKAVLSAARGLILEKSFILSCYCARTIKCLKAQITSKLLQNNNICIVHCKKKNRRGIILMEQ